MLIRFTYAKIYAFLKTGPWAAYVGFHDIEVSEEWYMLVVTTCCEGYGNGSYPLPPQVFGMRDDYIAAAKAYYVAFLRMYLSILE